jgi:hypothetical protein
MCRLHRLFKSCIARSESILHIQIASSILHIQSPISTWAQWKINKISKSLTPYQTLLSSGWQIHEYIAVQWIRISRKCLTKESWRKSHLSRIMTDMKHSCLSQLIKYKVHNSSSWIKLLLDCSLDYPQDCLQTYLPGEGPTVAVSDSILSPVTSWFEPASLQAIRGAHISQIPVVQT